MRRSVLIALFLSAAACVAARTAAGGGYDWWTGAAGDGKWSTKSNWSNNKVPGTGSNVCFDGDGETDCIVDVDATVRKFWIDGGFGGYGPYTHRVTVAAGVTLTASTEFDIAGDIVVYGAVRALSTVWDLGTYNRIYEDTEGTGSLTIHAGGVFELAPDAPFQTEPSTSLTLLGQNGNPVIFRTTTGTGAFSTFAFDGNLTLEYVEFHNTRNHGLQLINDAPHTAIAHHVLFMDPGATDVASQYVRINGTAWADYVFEYFSFGPPAGPTSPEYAVEHVVPSQTVTFRYYDVSAGCLYGDPETDPASNGIVIWVPADLAITEIVPSNSSPDTSEAISVAVKVVNIGSAPVTSSIRVDLFEDRGTAPSVGDTGDHVQTISSLMPGASTVLTFDTITNATAETWQMWAIVDTLNTITEEQESANNVIGPATVIWSSGGTRDLFIESITPGTTTPATGSTTTATVRVTNGGTVAVGSFRVDLFHNRGSAPSVGMTGDQSKTESVSLSPGASADVVLNISNPVPAEWFMYAIVDTNDTVAESDETNNVAGPSSKVTWQGLDLVVTSVSPSSSTPVVGSSISVNVTVKNNGNVAVGAAFDVGLFNDPGAPPSVGNGADKTESVPSGLAAGGTHTVTFTGVSSMTAGTWGMYAIADNIVLPGGIVEYNEANNVSSPAVSVTWREPDLMVVSITPSDANPTVGDTIDVTVVVRNQGDADAAGFDLGLFEHVDPGPPAVGSAADHTHTFASLATGQQASWTFTGITYGGSPTIWKMWAIVDNKAPAPGDVNESNEGNNVGGSVDVSWKAAATFPDLVVVSVTPSNATPSIGESIDVVVVVRNEGTASAGGFAVALFYDPPAVPNVGDAANASRPVTSLSHVPGSNEATVTFSNVSHAVAETWDMYAIVDNGQAVSEGNEGNNVSSPATSVSWRAPDLTVVSITPSLADQDIGQLISVAVEIRNDGDAAADGFVVGLYFDRSTPPTTADSPDATKPVASLGGGGATTVVSFTDITNNVLETWAMYALVDSTDGILESDEANNVSSSASVRWHGPDLVITAITPTNASPDVGTPIDITVSVQNNGDRPAVNFVVGLFYDRATAPTVSETPSETSAAVASLAGGGAQTDCVFTSVVNSASPAVWQTWAFADHGQAVLEDSESNNAGGPVTIIWGTPAVPDLTIMSVTPSTTTPDVGETISVTVRIRNEGTGTASGFTVGLYENRPDAPSAGETPDHTKTVAVLTWDPGAGTNNEKDVVFSGITTSTPGAWSMYVLVDSAGVVTEDDETNNDDGPTAISWRGIRVTAPNGGEEWEAGTTHDITWLSHEIGSSNVVIELSVDGGTSWTTVVASTEDDGEYSWTVPDSASTDCLIKVTAAGGSTPPSDQSDAVFTIIEKQFRPNLLIVSMAPSSAIPPVGSAIDIAVTVRNTGNAAAGMYYVDLFYDRDTPPSAGAVGDEQQVVGFLAAGEEVVVRFTGITNNATDAWTVYALVDSADFVKGETSDADNWYGPLHVGWSTLVPSFTITAPNGGESLVKGTAYTITWTFTVTGLPGTADLQISADGGVTWDDIAAGAPNSGSYQWLVDAGPCETCRVRISNASSGASDTSDRLFTILPEGADALLYVGEGCGTVEAGAAASLLLALASALLAVRRARR